MFFWRSFVSILGVSDVLKSIMPPTFTAISLDRLIDVRGVSNSQLEKKTSTPPPPPPPPTTTTTTTLSHEDISTQQPTTTTTTTTTEDERRRVDVNLIHKEDISVTQPAKEDERIIQENGSKEEMEMVVEDSIGEFSFTCPVSEVGTNGFHDHSIASSSSLDNGLVKAENLSQLVVIESDREYDCEDFFDPQDTISATSNTEAEDNSGVDRSLKMSTPTGEYFDAYEELSSEGGRSSSFRDVEPELREMRLNLLMEIERQRQAEEVLNNMQTQWQRLQQQLSLVGLTLPAAPTITEDENWSCDSAEDLLKQIHIARVVSESVGRGFAKAEVEKEMESRIESKNFEITRLWDRLHYYETVNREMSQRNQESIEIARSQRERRKRRQRWFWNSIGAVITLGTVALAWSYLPTASGSSSAQHSDAPEVDDITKP